jgi:hypothetical protein
VIGWNRFGDDIYLVLARAEASPFQVPVWMTATEAAAMTVRATPRIELAALRSLRRLLDATPAASDARSSIDREEQDEKALRVPAEPIRQTANGGRDPVTPDHSNGAGQAASAGAPHWSPNRPKTGG